MTTAAITLGSGKMPVFQERTSELLLKQAETLHNMARRAKDRGLLDRTTGS